MHFTKHLVPMWKTFCHTQVWKEYSNNILSHSSRTRLVWSPHTLSRTLTYKSADSKFRWSLEITSSLYFKSRLLSKFYSQEPSRWNPYPSLGLFSLVAVSTIISFCPNSSWLQDGTIFQFPLNSHIISRHWNYLPATSEWLPAAATSIPCVKHLYHL